MQYLALCGILALLFTNIWGSALAVGWFWRDRWLALVLGPLLLTLGFFGIESYIGLGSLQWLLALATPVSIALILLSARRQPPRWLPARIVAGWQSWAEELGPTCFAESGAVFLIVFLYALTWRMGFPDIDGSSEKIADLSYISSYLWGDKIPVVDAWLYPYKSIQYYSFQHYGAALMGRLLGLSPGATYNIAFCLLVALGGTAFAGVVFKLADKTWVRVLVLAAFLVGGSGATLLVHFTDKNVTPWSAMRFIGSAPFDRTLGDGSPPTPAPLAGFLQKYAANHPKMDLPGEPFSYSIYLGDYHAPLSGYYLLGTAAISAILWQYQRKRRYIIIVGATLTWSILANTWILPLQGLGVAAWVLFNLRDWRKLIFWAAVGAAAVWAIAVVYLDPFLVATSSYKSAIRLVGKDQHTPPLLFLIFLFPTIGLGLLGLFSGVRIGRILGVVSLAYLLFSEFVFVDDIYSGMYERFNTTLKWWPWIAAATLLALGPILLQRAKYKWVRWAAVFFCAYPCLYAYDLWSNWLRPQKTSFGKIDGTQFLTRDSQNSLMLERLKLEPRGVVIERPMKEAFTNSAVLPLFAGQHLWLGWVGHEQLWRGYREDIPYRQQKIFDLYNGSMADAGAWARAQGIDYILWYQAEDTPELWTKVDRAVTSDYEWCEVYTRPDNFKVGLWRLKHLSH